MPFCHLEGDFEWLLKIYKFCISPTSSLFLLSFSKTSFFSCFNSFYLLSRIKLYYCELCLEHNNILTDLVFFFFFSNYNFNIIWAIYWSNKSPSLWVLNSSLVRPLSMTNPLESSKTLISLFFRLSGFSRLWSVHIITKQYYQNSKFHIINVNCHVK